MPRASRYLARGSAGAGGNGSTPTRIAWVDAFLGGIAMKLWVGVTDPDWFAFLSRADVDEVNFWQPSATAPFVGLESGAPFLFKLKRPYNHIAGGGTFVKFSTLPLSIAWEVFERKNGAESREAFEAMIRPLTPDRKSTRLNSSHANISYAVFCLKKKQKLLPLYRLYFGLLSDSVPLRLSPRISEYHTS